MVLGVYSKNDGGGECSKLGSHVFLADILR